MDTYIMMVAHGGPLNHVDLSPFKFDIGQH